jgi:hypothetical protein
MKDYLQQTGGLPDQTSSGAGTPITAGRGLIVGARKRDRQLGASIPEAASVTIRTCR